jgi:hypothetical protein
MNPSAQAVAQVPRPQALTAPPPSSQPILTDFRERLDGLCGQLQGLSEDARTITERVFGSEMKLQVGANSVPPGTVPPSTSATGDIYYRLDAAQQIINVLRDSVDSLRRL